MAAWLRSLFKYLSTLEEKFRISKRPCNVLYFFNPLLNTLLAKTRHFLAESFTIITSIKYYFIILSATTLRKMTGYDLQLHLKVQNSI